jgi:serine/threonine protein kinase
MVQDSNNTATPDRASTIGTGDIPPDEKRKKVGNYIILKTIGEGSFAKVRLGVHLITEMKVSRIDRDHLISVVLSFFSSYLFSSYMIELRSFFYIFQ